jgi:hypothetical protein
LGIGPAKRSQHRIVGPSGVSDEQRRGFLDRIVEVAVQETAQEAIDGQVVPESEGPLWGLAWRARAAWILRHRSLLERALNEPDEKERGIRV